MKPLTKATAVALIQVLLVCSLGAKLLYDRRTRPRAWFKTQRYDPNLPIRGRYVSLQIELKDPRSAEEIENKFRGEIQMMESQNTRANYRGAYDFGRECGSIDLRNAMPSATFDEGKSQWDCDNLPFVRWKTGTETRLRLTEPILFFISDTAKDPTRLAAEEELWVLATIPHKGPPRPISLGIKKSGEGVITPLNLN